MKITLLEKIQSLWSSSLWSKTQAGVHRINLSSPLVNKPQYHQDFPEETFRVHGNRGASLNLYTISHANDKKIKPSLMINIVNKCQ